MVIYFNICNIKRPGCSTIYRHLQNLSIQEQLQPVLRVVVQQSIAATVQYKGIVSQVSEKSKAEFFLRMGEAAWFAMLRLTLT